MTPRGTTSPDAAQAAVVVGVGASAGGLEALRSFLKGVDPAASAAYLVAQHLSPTHPSMLAELLRRDSPIPVREAVNGDVMAPGVVMVTPPGFDVEVSGGRLALTALAGTGGPRPSINALFASLAESFGPRAVGIVLSGTGSDGTAGLIEVRTAGGLAIAQSRGTAQYDGMPGSAVESGAADLELPPEEMGAVIAHLAGLLPKGRHAATHANASFAAVVEAVEAYTGVRLSQYKPATVERRIRRRMSLKRLAAVDDYLALVTSEPAEAHELVKDVFIGVTEFFRDLDSFLALQARLKNLFAERTAARDTVRIWVAGCSTGQEAYTVAMVAEEARLAAGHGSYQIFATDISARAVEIARRGVYGAEAAEQIPASFLAAYFTADRGRYQAKPVIRDRILFSVQDLAKDPPFARLDLVTCRNVLIYFNTALQDRTMAMLNYALQPDGLLMLGRSEASHPPPHYFAEVDATHRFYRSLVASDSARTAARVAHLSAEKAANIARRPPASETETIRRLVLEKCASLVATCAVAVDETNNVLFSLGRIGAFTAVRGGAPSLDLLDMVSEDLRVPLRATIYKSRRTREPMTRTRVPWTTTDGVEVAVDITVHQFPEARIGALLVLLDAVPATPGDAIASAPSPMLRELEAELASARENLEAVVSELESTNEELQSSNEELQASNEELQATNEELQTANEELLSTNEELRSLNDELGAKNAALEELSNDLDNIERSLGVPLLVLARDLTVRRFSAALSQVCTIAEVREGDAFAALPWTVRFPPETEAALRAVATGGDAGEIEAVGEDRTFQLDVAPYRSSRDELTGVIVSFLDVSQLKTTLSKVERERVVAVETLSAFAEGFLKTDARGIVELVNPAAAALIGWTQEEAVGRSLDEVLVLSPDGAKHRLPNLALEAMRTGERIRSDAPAILVGHGGQRTVVEYAATPIADDGAVVTLRDVGERERMAAEIEWRGSHDVLTGALNRQALEQALDRAVESARQRNRPFCLLYLDIDKFKIVNDTSGHVAGDQLLRDFTHMLRDSVRAGDIVARIGGDEFAVVLDNCRLEDGERIANNLVRKVNNFVFTWGERSHTIGLSVGFVVVDRLAASTTFDLMADADIALYEAKVMGGGRIEIYRQDDNPTSHRAQFTVLAEINRALSENALLLYCQPIVSATTGAWAGIEVLSRLRDRSGRVVPPNAFLPAAERYGLIRRLDRAVVRNTFAALAMASRHWPIVTTLDVHINVAGSTLSDRDFFDFVRACAAEHFVEMRRVIFEVTESAAILDLGVARAFAAGIRRMGGRIALDDFGKGMSSFDYLRTLEIDMIKLDGSFVSGVSGDPINQAIVRATVDVARAMKTVVVAEMVSAQIDADFLRGSGVDQLQGYLIAKPEPIEDWFARFSEQV